MLLIKEASVLERSPEHNNTTKLSSWTVGQASAISFRRLEVVKSLSAEGVGEKLVFTAARLMNQLQRHAHNP